MTFDEWYDSQPLVLLDRKTEHRLTWEAAIQQQAAEISRLKGVIAKCKEALEDSHQNINQERGFASEIEHDIEQALAAIKEEGL